MKHNLHNIVPITFVKYSQVPMTDQNTILAVKVSLGISSMIQ